MTSQLIPPSEALRGYFESSIVSTIFSAEKKQTEKLYHHGFWISNIGFLLPQRYISEVSEQTPVSRLPNTPNWLCGMTNLRGNIVPVFDFNILLGIHSKQKNNRKQVSVCIDDQWVAIYSDGLPTRVLVNHEDQMDKIPPIPDQLQPFVSRCYKQEEHIWLDWDIDGFFKWLTNNM